MGLAASQARLLTLTARMSDLELQGQRKSGQKQRLAVQSEAVTKEYTDALATTKLQFTGSGTVSNTVDLTAKSLMNCGLNGNLDAQRLLLNTAGQVMVDSDTADMFNTSGGKLANFLALEGATTYTRKDTNNKTEVSYEEKAKYNAAKEDLDAKTTTANSAQADVDAKTVTQTAAQADVDAKDKTATAKDTAYTTAQADTATAKTQVDSDNAAISSLQAEGNKDTTDASGKTVKYSTTTEYAQQMAQLQKTLAADTATHAQKAAAEATALGEKTAAEAEATTAKGVLATATSALDEANKVLSEANKDVTKAQATLDACGLTTSEPSATNTKYYTNLYNEMTNNGSVTIDSSDFNSSSWLTKQLKNGGLTLEKYSSTKKDSDGNVVGGFNLEEWATEDYGISETTDSTTTAKAQAKYDAEMAKFNAKDKQLDLDMKNIDTEHNAIQTEYDSVKKVIDKNIERSFKIFNS